MITCDGGATGKVQSVTANLFGVDAVQAKQADFVWIFMGWEGIAAQRQGIQLNAFSPTAYCVPNYYTPVIITNESMVQQKADVVQRFMRATARGFNLAISDPDQAADIFLKAAPAASFPDVDLLRDSARYLAPKYAEGTSRWGEQDLQVWTDYPRFMIKTGLVKDANGATVTSDLDYASFFTNDFLPR
jgi:ABC-type nitrate/sulfonate/bicarbonate transport system substrate-binding protein